MRLRDDVITRTSLLATALVAGLLGIATVPWSPAAEGGSPSGVLPPAFEVTRVMTAPVGGRVLALAPSRETMDRGEPVAFTARLTNVRDDRSVAREGGVHDLAVQRTATPEPMGLG